MRREESPAKGDATTLPDRVVGVLDRYPLGSMVILLALGIFVLQWQMSRLASRLVDAAALQGTGLYSSALAEFRSLYTAEVVARVASKGIEVTHDYREKPGAIPLPATLAMELGSAIGAKGSGLEVRLFSAHPFPWRRGTGGPQDAFEREAIEQLGKNPKQPFYRIEEGPAGVSLRYATADLMRPACVTCHNTHPDSPKKDWKEGDVRGVLSVKRPLSDLRAETRAGLQETFVTMAAMTLTWLLLLGVVIGRLHRTGGLLRRRVTEVEEREASIRLMNEQLTVARDEALAANHAKSEFLATMSHELRTPLNHILGYSEILDDEVKGRGHADLSSDIQKIHAAGSDLLGIVNDVLDLSRIDAGRMEVELEDFDVRGVVNEVVAAIRPLAEKHGNAVSVEVAPQVSTMHADLPKIRQSLFNLMSNACKFTQNGEVTLTVTVSSDPGRRYIDFHVKDTGIGIPTEHLGRLFRSFSMADSSTTRKHGGTGLGLVISKRFSQMMGGDITVASEVARGSTFTLKVPDRVEPRAPRAPRKSGSEDPSTP